jgi:hypothetical protein
MRAFQALKMARAAGVTVHVSGEKLRLQSPKAPHSDLLDALRQHKAEIIVLLTRDGWDGKIGSPFSMSEPAVSSSTANFRDRRRRLRPSSVALSSG